MMDNNEVNFKEKFAIMHFLDSARWRKPDHILNSDEKGSLINYAYDLTEDEKILTHWLVYITERQMEFEQIWDKGGFVFSEIVYKYTKNKNLDCIDYDKEQSLFVKGEDGDYIFRSKFALGSLEEKSARRERLERYYSSKELGGSNISIEFKSRYYTTDYLYMRYTLYTLLDYGCSISKYIADAIRKADDTKLTLDKRVDNAVLAMAYALYRLTYNPKDKKDEKEIYYFSKKENGKKRNFITADKLDDFIKKDFNELAKFRKENIKSDVFGKSVKDNISKFFGSKSESAEKYTSMKRLWCAFRDFLKSPEYCGMFRKLIETQLGSQYQSLIEALFSEDNNCQAACRNIELPGDVWNENSVFRRCISKSHSGKLGVLLRKEYENLKITIGYPEEFDTTFDFVPRMCEKGNCDICPFAKLREYPKQIFEEKVQMLCVDDNTKYCPLVLTYCGYYHICNGRESCELFGWLHNK